MNNLIGGLLGGVSADVNAMPDNKYEGVIFKSELVVVDKKSEVSHVITYMVGAGDSKGKQKAEWFKLGKDPVRDDNGVLTGFTPTMSEAAKPWYRKRLEDLGVAASAIDGGTFQAGDLVGTEVNFGVKTKDGYQNVSFAEKRGVTAPGGTVSTPAAGPAATLTDQF